MRLRRLGNTDLRIFPLALGGNVFGWTIDRETSFKILDAFIDGGGNLIDTADVYGRWVPGNIGGESESIIGNWLKQSGKREKVIIATKVGMEMGEARKGLSRKYIIEEVEDSLRRLQTDHIDLYQAHKDDPDIPQEETLEAFSEMIRQGKVRFIGASNFNAERLSSALEISGRLGYPRYESLQPIYNLCNREEFEEKLLPVCLKEGLGVITYFSLARGFLSGKYRSEEDLSKSVRGSGIKPFLNERGMRILHALDQVARQYESTPATIALAWSMARPGITAPISSATSLEQLNELLAAAHLELYPSAMEILDEASAYLVEAR